MKGITLKIKKISWLHITCMFMDQNDSPIEEQQIFYDKFLEIVETCKEHIAVYYPERQDELEILTHFTIKRRNS